VSLRTVGFWLGVVVCLAMVMAEPPPGMPFMAWRTAAVAALMAIWWFSEAIPVAATGGLPFLLLPMLGVQRGDEVAANYMSPVLFLILGSAMLGLALEKWGLHRRLALLVLQRSAMTPSALLLSVMGITAFASLWINNSAATVMMLPIAGAVLAASTRTMPAQGGTPNDDSERRYACAMALGVAWASNVGGLGTLIGTPVNVIAAASIAKVLEVRITFLDWLIFGIPIVIVCLPVAWWLLRATVMRGQPATPQRADVLAAIGPQAPMAAPEWRVMAVLALTCAGWVLVPWIEKRVTGFTDAAVAMLALLLLCLVPSGRVAGEKLLAWDDTRRAPWYLVMLLGGGIALADAVTGSGLAAWLGESLRGVAGQPLWILLPMIAFALILITECASNVATAATFIPLVAALAAGGGHDPVMFAVTAGIAASWGFANPAGTSSNAMAFATGHVRMPEMVRSGLWFDLLGAALLAALCAVFVPLALG
jgi:sodium-dependent dicarboxylate transporter 2/3/5